MFKAAPRASPSKGPKEFASNDLTPLRQGRHDGAFIAYSFGGWDLLITQKNELKRCSIPAAAMQACWLVLKGGYHGLTER